MLNTARAKITHPITISGQPHYDLSLPVTPRYSCAPMMPPIFELEAQIPYTSPPTYDQQASSFFGKPVAHYCQVGAPAHRLAQARDALKGRAVGLQRLAAPKLLQAEQNSCQTDDDITIENVLSFANVICYRPRKYSTKCIREKEHRVHC